MARDRERAAGRIAAPLPVARLDAPERLACLRLIRSENVGPATFRQLVNHFGGAEAALAALPDLSRHGGRGRPIRICGRAEAEAELEAASRGGSAPLFTIEPDYPYLLAQLDLPPPLLYVKGRRDLLNRPAVAVVGSRQASAAGQKLARHLASGLAVAGFVVVSGLARGIDAAAHQAALDKGTIAVVAGGIDVVYPPEHAVLQERIGVDGCLVSEQPPGFQPRGKDFPRRNRIISGLALGVVAVEAARRSGSLITARRAGEQGREVFAVPGHPLDPRAEGTNLLLKDGATLVTEPDDILRALRPITGLSPDDDGRLQDRRPAAPVASEGPPPAIGDRDRSTVLAVLGPAPINVDELARAAGLPARTLQVVLLELALAGRIEHHGHQLVSLRLGQD